MINYENDGFLSLSEARSYLRLYVLTQFVARQRLIAGKVTEKLLAYLNHEFETNETVFINEALEASLNDNCSSYSQEHFYDGRREYESNPPVSMTEISFACHITLACIYADSFSPDECFNHLKKASELIKQTRKEYIARFIPHLSLSTSGLLVKPCRLFADQELTSYLKEGAQIISYVIDIFWEWKSNLKDSRPIGSRSDYPTLILLESSFRPKSLSIVSRAQLINSYKRGLIKEKAFKNRLDKFDEEVVKHQLFLSKIQEFYQNTRPDIELSNNVYFNNQTGHAATLYPDYNQERFTHLNEDQQAEYLKAFSAPYDPELSLKYLPVRVNELLLGIIHKNNSVDVSKIQKEIEFYLNSDVTSKNEFKVVLGIIYHLNEIGPVQKLLKVTELSKLDEEAIKPKGVHAELVVLVDDEDNIKIRSKKNEKNFMPINASEHYFNFAIKDIKKIVRYKETGRFPR